MSNELKVLQEIQIASPCDASWEEMRGDERCRFCEQCQLHVYNLTAMSAPEAAALVREKEGRLCVRYHTRPDGTVLTRDCPVGFQAARRRVISRLATAAAALAGLFGFRWSADPAGASPKKGKSSPPQTLIGAPRPSTRATMGDIVLPATPPQPAGQAAPHHTMGKIAVPHHAGVEMGEVAIQRPSRRPMKKRAGSSKKATPPRQGSKPGRKQR